jgi:hypothetical protein
MRKHLACETGRNVQICANVPSEVRKRFKTDQTGTSKEGGTTQSTLFQAFAQQQAGSVDEAWLDFFVQNDLAFNVANSSSYKQLNACLMSATKAIKPPSAWQLANRLLDKGYSQAKAQVLLRFVCLQVDKNVV